MIRLEQMEGGKPVPEDERFLEGTYIECPVDIEELRSDTKRDATKEPGEFAAMIHFISAFETINEDTKCTGTLIDAINAEKERMRAEMEKNS